MAPWYLTTKIGQDYRVIAMPIKPCDNYPAIGLYGVCKWTSSKNGACLEIDGKQDVIPFDCIEEAHLRNIEDALLITAMIDNPKSVLKLLKGLWRMTKEKSIRDLMERGELPTDPSEPFPSNGKTSKDFARQWEEVAASGAFTSEL